MAAKKAKKGAGRGRGRGKGRGGGVQITVNPTPPPQEASGSNKRTRMEDYFGSVVRKITLPGETPAEHTSIPQNSTQEEAPTHSTSIPQNPPQQEVPPQEEVPPQQNAQTPLKGKVVGKVNTQYKSALSTKGKAASKSQVKGKSLISNKKIFKWKKRAPYEDLSNSMRDADDPDDPGFPENYALGSEPASGGIGMYKPSVTHVIFNKEGSYFPGLVVEVDEPLIWVRSMCKGSNPAPDAWEWPEVEDLEE